MLSPQLRKIKIQLEEGATNIDIDKEELLAELNEMEADYARIVADLSQQAKEKVNVETECDLIEQISLVA